MTVDLLARFDSLRSPRVLVVGDVRLERCTWGHASGVSHEAPALAMTANRREARLAGAGSIATLLRRLEAEVTCAGVTGDDADGCAVCDLLAESGVDTTLLQADASRSTPTCERYFVRSHSGNARQVLRIDAPAQDWLTSTVENRLAVRVLEALDAHDVVLVADEVLGTCTPRLLRVLIDQCRRVEKPVIVAAAQQANFTSYRGATGLLAAFAPKSLANVDELADEALHAGRKFCRELKLEFSALSLGGNGLALAFANSAGEFFAAQPNDTSDAARTDDIVAATIALGLGGGLDAADAVRLTHLAATTGTEVSRAALLTRLLAMRPANLAKRVTLEQLAMLAASHRALGQKLVLTVGSFDGLNLAHLRHLEAAAGLGEALIVVLQSDASFARSRRPSTNESERAALLAALGCVRYITLCHDAEALAIIERLRPDVLTNPAARRPEQVPGYQFVRSYDGQVRTFSLSALNSLAA